MIRKRKMASRRVVGKEIVLVCEQCHNMFTYKLKRSNNRKHLCEKCSDLNTEQSKRVFEEKGRNSMQRKSRVQRILDSIPDYDINPDRILQGAFREAT